MLLVKTFARFISVLCDFTQSEKSQSQGCAKNGLRIYQSPKNLKSLEK